MTHRRGSDLNKIAAPPFRPAPLLAGLVLFGIGFGFVEAVIVVDLRAILTPLSHRIAGASADRVFPLIAFDQHVREDPAAARLLRIELLREAATLLMLAGAGLAAGRTFVQRFSAFVIAFGVWDLCYYLGLKLLSGWPASLQTWDVLFLIPVPWAAPVLAPVSAAASMVIAGSAVLWWESAGRPFAISPRHWASMVAGGFIIVASFCSDWRNIASGSMPNPFPWPLFLAGEAVGSGAFLHAWRRNWNHPKNT
jgi:hypothetical protein